jgi:protein tyrosine phosphatase (PTP) superfamily phosphohydrolase (DUF442 family)
LARLGVRGTFSQPGPSRPAAAVRLARTLCLTNAPLLNAIHRLLATAFLALSAEGQLFAQTLAAPNVVPISDSIVTSGQPSAQALSTLAARGFQAVIYLAPMSVSDAVKEEPELLAKQGIEFVHIPIPFGKPDESHFMALSSALTRLQDKKVLVHCQVNMRASSLVFLHRAINQRADPQRAYEAVATVWSPQGPWRQLLVEQLAKHRINFEPY